jgi:hypothetical protein
MSEILKENLARNGIAASLPGGPMKNLVSLLLLAICWTWGTGVAHACSCDPLSPDAGFDRAQYVFMGRVVKADHHVWLVEVERVWKGHEKLARTAKLMDIYAGMDCELFFELGRSYVFFAVLAKGGRDVFYHPHACNWTRPLRSTRVPARGNDSLWIEDWIVREHGPGEPPRGERSQSSSTSSSWPGVHAVTTPPQTIPKSMRVALDHH